MFAVVFFFNLVKCSVFTDDLDAPSHKLAPLQYPVAATQQKHNVEKVRYTLLTHPTKLGYKSR
jgi:hypothetical protein